MRFTCFLPAVLPLLALAMFAGSARAQVTLAFDTLPSAQGFDYVVSGNAAPESSVFSVSNGTLLQNSLGVGFSQQGSNRYENTTFTGIDLSQDFTAAIRLRIDGYSGGNDFGFGFGAFTGTYNTGVGIGQGVANLYGQRISVDTSVFHEYRVFSSSTGLSTLFIDDVEVATSQASILNFTPTLLFGDVTGGANAAATVASVRFFQGSSAAAPEPGSLCLLAVGVMLLGPHIRRARIGKDTVRLGK